MKAKDIKERAARARQLIIDELVKRGHKVKERKDKPWMDRCVVVDGIKVPMQVKEVWSGSFGRRGTGKLKCAVDWVWVGMDIKLKRRSFPSSKARAVTEGLDIEKICDHLEKWMVVHTLHSGLEKKAKDAKDHWRMIVKTIQRDYPKADLKATAYGVHIRLPATDEDHARAVLSAMYGEPV